MHVCVCVSVCACLHMSIHVHTNTCMRISLCMMLFKSFLRDYRPFVILIGWILYTFIFTIFILLRCFIPMFIIFTLVVPKMYPWQVRDDFNKDVYIESCQLIRTNKLHWNLKHDMIFSLSSPGQNGQHFADDIFKCIFMNEKSGILIRISPNFVPKDPIDNDNPALV